MLKTNPLSIKFCIKFVYGELSTNLGEEEMKRELGEGSNQTWSKYKNAKLPWKKHNNMDVKLKRLKCSFLGIICSAPIFVVFRRISLAIGGGYFNKKMVVTTFLITYVQSSHLTVEIYSCVFIFWPWSLLNHHHVTKLKLKFARAACATWSCDPRVP